ncbi:MAG TPA: glycosyltransferase family 39 protein [Verrucomicrobiae bacterium]
MMTPEARPRFFQRTWTFWFMVAVLAVVAIARLRLLDFPLERDEGEYAYAGQLILQGIPPYELAYNMKFPGTYLAYAVIMRIFGETPAGIHLGILLMTTATALMLFWLGKKILDDTAGMVAATAYAVLAASPSMLGLAGHATHFCAFFATAGLCALWLARQNGKWPAALASGLLFGTAILMKQHAAIIAAWAGIAFAAGIFRRKEIQFPKRLATIAAFDVGIILPFGLCCLILWHAGVFGKFWFWTIDYARQYATITPLSEAGARLWSVLPWIISTTVLLWLLAVAGLMLAWFDERLRQARFWLLGFALASALTVIPGFYFRVHYFLLTLPAVALFAGCAVSGIIWLQKKNDRPQQLRNSVMAVYVVFLAATIFVNRDIWFVKTPDQASRAIYGLPLFSEAENVANFIRTNSVVSARIAVIGSEPEIYFLAHRHSATGYLYTYPLMEPQPFALTMQEEMIREVETNAPEFIVTTDNAQSLGVKPGAKVIILDWWNSYRTNYIRVALADTASSLKTKSQRGVENSAEYKPSQDTSLEVFQRKS